MCNFKLVAQYVLFYVWRRIGANFGQKSAAEAFTAPAFPFSLSLSDWLLRFCASLCFSFPADFALLLDPDALSRRKTKTKLKRPKKK